MAKIKDKKQYDAACARIEELLKVVSNNTPTDDKNYLELDLLSDLVADYEEEHFPVETPLLVDVLKLRMYEMNLLILVWGYSFYYKCGNKICIVVNYPPPPDILLSPPPHTFAP